MHIPFVDLSAQYQKIKGEIDQAIHEVIDQTSFVGGKFVQKFEEEFRLAYGVDHCVSCGNGTDSLYIIMKMLGVGPGDEVITAANSWISSSETVTQTGARVVFVDVDPVYYSMDETKLEEKITPRTKAVIAVHLQGQMCNMDAIQAICKKHNLHLIEDCAQSHFSAYKGKRAGLFGIAGSFSFYPGKNLGAYGDAGCMITNDAALAEKLTLFSRHGALKKHQHLMEGINSRMDSIQAAILSVKLKYLSEWTEKRIAHAQRYNELLRPCKEVITPAIRPDTNHTFHLYVIRVKDRARLMYYLAERGIECSIHYPTALPNLPAYAYLNHKPEDFPVATALQSEIVSLPMYAELKDEMIQEVCATIIASYGG